MSKEKKVDLKNREVMKTLQVEILSLKEGLQKFDAKIVRITDKRFTILLMDDYTDSLGQIEGSVQVITEDKEYNYENIVGYYVYKNNLFSLMIEEKDYV